MIIQTIKTALFALMVILLLGMPKGAIGADLCEKQYVAFVNVAGAIDDNLFSEAVTNFLKSAMPARVIKFDFDNVDVAYLLNPRTMDKRLGERVVLAVYFVSTDKLPRQVIVPNKFAVLNVAGLNKGADLLKLQQRVRKMVLKGLAFVCGFGANQDIGRCVMGAGSFDTLAGLDATSASYSPFVAFPLMDYLVGRKLLENP